MKKQELRDALGSMLDSLEAVYDQWHELPGECKDAMEHVFALDQGCGFHIYRAFESARELLELGEDELEKLAHGENIA